MSFFLNCKMLVSPQIHDRFPCGEPKRSITQNLSRLLSHAISSPSGGTKSADETLFQLSYEIKPLNSNADYR